MGQHTMTRDPCDPFEIVTHLTHWPMTHWPIAFSAVDACAVNSSTEGRASRRSSATQPPVFSTEKWLNEIHYQPVSTSKTITDDASIEVVEIIIADCSRVSSVIDFQSSLVWRTSVSGQPDIWTSSFSDYTQNVHEKVRTIFLLTRGQSNLTKSASRGAHSRVRGHPRGSKFVPLNSLGRGSY